MTANDGIILPASGLAGEILTRFLGSAQRDADQLQEGAECTAPDSMHHLVTFNLGTEEYGVEICSVQEIIRATGITPVPGAPAHVQGIINLRGKIIPVVDLRKRFFLPEAGTNDSQRIVVVELGEKQLGMIVDSVSQVIKVPSAVIEDLPVEATTLSENFIRGVGKLENRLIIILDLSISLLNV